MPGEGRGLSSRQTQYVVRDRRLGNLATPINVQKLQRALHAKAKAEAGYRFYALYDKIHRDDILTHAYAQCCSNKGAPGVDGQEFADVEAYGVQRWLGELALALRQETYRPEPIRRVFIPKVNGKLRPLGISTLKDRVVQMLLKMVLEPIWESDFLNCSNGFRPGRRTMDCIALLDSYINERNKYFWVIEGDIRAAFDSIHQATLLTLLAERVADRRLLELIDGFLKAGMMQGQLFHRTDIGTPQGAICSPLLSNVYLHQLDLYWWRRYGGLHRKAKERRRQAHQGNCALIR